MQFFSSTAHQPEFVCGEDKQLKGSGVEIFTQVDLKKLQVLDDKESNF